MCLASVCLHSHTIQITLTFNYMVNMDKNVAYRVYSSLLSQGTEPLKVKVAATETCEESDEKCHIRIDGQAKDWLLMHACQEKRRPLPETQKLHRSALYSRSLD